MTKSIDKQEVAYTSRVGEALERFVRSCSEKPQIEFSKFGERIKKVRTDIAGHTRDQFAEYLGITRSSLQLYEDGKREPKASLLALISVLYGVHLDWLLLGLGEMLKANWSPLGTDSSQPSAKTGSCECHDTLGNPVDLEEFVFIPRYNLKAAAGHGAAVAGEAPMFSMSFRRYWIENYLRVDPKDLSVLSVKGDSMEGVLNNKDVILVNHADTAPTSGLYVLRMDGDLIVKRVQKLPGSKLKILSANEVYEPFVIDMISPEADFAVIGRVVWFGRQI